MQNHELCKGNCTQKLSEAEFAFGWCADCWLAKVPRETRYKLTYDNEQKKLTEILGTLLV